MSSNVTGIKRRDFLKTGVLAGLSAALGGSLIRVSYAASRDRVTALSSIGLDSLHPYAHSSSPQYGIWQKENFRDVTEMQAPDDLTVVFTTEKPNAVFLDRLQNRFMISKAVADAKGEQADQTPIGTGAYRFVSWQRDGNLVMTRNDDYWHGKVAVKEIVLRRVKE